MSALPLLLNVLSTVLVGMLLSGLRANILFRARVKASTHLGYGPDSALVPTWNVYDGKLDWESDGMKNYLGLFNMQDMCL